MMGQLGFSYIGLIFLLMLFLPNLLWTRCKPRGYQSDNENRILVCLEKIGQVLVTCTVLIFEDFNLHAFSLRSIWLLCAFGFMLLYEYWWLCYFRSNRQLQDFYSDLSGITVAGATLPVLAGICLALYGRNLWLMISILLLGIGHIGIHIQHRMENH